MGIGMGERGDNKHGFKFYSSINKIVIYMNILFIYLLPENILEMPFRAASNEN